MNIEKKTSELFDLDDETWMQHTNPLSVYSRTLALPLLAVSIWSRVWIGWYALIPFILAVVYTWINPRLFGKPRTTNSWASKAVLGERVWIDREEVSIPDHHAIMPHILNTISGVGMIIMIWGLFDLHLWATSSGLTLQIVGKYWFLDRMVWLFEDMKHLEKYAKWIY